MGRTLDLDGLDGLIPAPSSAAPSAPPPPQVQEAAPALPPPVAQVQVAAPHASPPAARVQEAAPHASPPAARVQVAAPALPSPAPVAARPPAKRRWAVFAALAAAAAVMILVLALYALREQGTASIAEAPVAAPSQPAEASAPEKTPAPAPDSPAAPPAVAAATVAAAKVEPPAPAAVPAEKEPEAGASADLMAETRFPGTYGLNSIEPAEWTEAEVTAVVAALQRCAGQIDVTGHACALGASAVNKNIGWLRARAVKRILVARGVDGERIRVRSAGSTEPLDSNKLENGRRLNRRVTVSCHAP